MSENKKIHVGFVDDDSYIIDIFKGSVISIFKKYGIDADFETFVDPSRVIEEAKEEFDILFCDIEMPDMDGITLSSLYKEKHPFTEIIFISNREDKVFDSLTVHPFGFVRKKNFLNDIQKIIASYVDKKLMAKPAEYISVKQGTNVIKIYIDDIIYIETNKRNQYIHLVNREMPVETTLTMKALCDALESKGFIYCHKSFLVNYRFIKEIRTDTILLTDGTSVYLARRKATEVKEKYMELIKDDDFFVSIG